LRLYSVPSILLLTSLSGFAQTGSLSGSVLDDAGKAKPGVWVTAVRITVPPARATAATDKNGAFLLPGLPPGAYRICAQVPGGGFLDPCEWSDYTTSVRSAVNVLSGQTAAAVRIQLQSATALQVRIDDPQKLLDPAHPERDVVVGVFSGAGGFHLATIQSADAAGRLHQVWVPFDAPVKLHISSAQLSLADATGAPAAATGVSLPVSQSKTAPAAQPVAFTITGLKHP
jgi:hypothetical protein